jgi:hypothetical protein
VTLDEIGRQGSLPIVAPVKPYTEFALIYNPTTVNDEIALHRALIQLTFNASCRPSSTARLNGSVSFFKSALARLRAEIKSSNIVGKSPLRFVAVAKKSTGQADTCQHYASVKRCIFTIIGSLNIITIFLKVQFIYGRLI